MCGICGVVTKGSRSLFGSQFLEMSRVLRHRGPDDEGYFTYDSTTKRVHNMSGTDTVPELKAVLPPLTAALQIHGVAFGHRRLAIVDPSARGHQPMTDETRRRWIVFNGEIYNWRDVRKELEALGHVFRSATDTEVILKSYEQWGHGCVLRFNGEWAFAICDLQSRLLFLSRDRFGIKPLYWSDDTAGFAFASEPKALLAHSGSRPVADHDSIWDYLIFARTNHLAQTFFRSVNSLEPGTNATYCLDTGRFQRTRFYHLSDLAQESQQTLSNGQSFRDLFLDAVRVRSISEVPLGVTLSGGIDSSSIAVALRLFTNESTNAFIADSSQGSIDASYARSVSHLNGFTTHVVPTEPLSLDDLQRLMYAHDQPIQDWAGAVGLWQIHETSSHYVKVCLEGHGADEYLLGYPFYDMPYLLYLLRNQDIFSMWSELNLLSSNYYDGHSSWLARPVTRSVRQLIPEAAMNLAARSFGDVTTSPRRMVTSQFFNRYRWAARPGRETYREPIGLRAAVLRNFYVERLPYFLHQSDRNGMANSVETRVPYLDHRLIQYILTRPQTGLVEGGLRKAPLRNSVRGLLPEKVRGRIQKQGMTSDITKQWLDQHKTRHAYPVSSEAYSIL